jgi:uncharacterized protein DUF5676
MKLNVWPFGFAVGIAIAAAFTICAFFVAIAPETTAATIGYLLHIDLSGISRPISWPSYIAGVLAIGVWTGLWAAAAAGIYNSTISK